MSLQSSARTLQRSCLRQSSVTQACRQQLRHLSSRPSSAFPPLLRTSTHLIPAFQSQQRRCESTARPLTDRPDQLPKVEPREEVPSYEMTFTCKACSTRSSHRMSKQGYHHGTILITCQLLKKGALDSESDMEFWDDEALTKSYPHSANAAGLHHQRNLCEAAIIPLNSSYPFRHVK
ncbi:unnamed protein product [Aureobasidium pullulans]|nr:unnamed protein product [Aureobasidium pullulans]